jgi:hypothetical protein
VHVRQWIDLTRPARPDLVAAPAALLAFAAWRVGKGALANLAIDRALTAEPDHRLALLVQTILDRGLPPSILDGPDEPAATERPTEF